MLPPAAAEALKKIVCKSLYNALSGQEYEPTNPGECSLEENCGCFVTLKIGERLRGCLGCFTSTDPLYQTVSRMTQGSALEDPRFTGNRLNAENLAEINFDISILSPLIPCTSPLDIKLGKDGIYLKKEWQSGCFLPQVATETGWNVEEFWSNCCSHKAELPANAWRDSDIELFTFTAEIIEDSYRNINQEK